MRSRRLFFFFFFSASDERYVLRWVFRFQHIRISVFVCFRLDCSTKRRPLLQIAKSNSLLGVLRSLTSLSGCKKREREKN